MTRLQNPDQVFDIAVDYVLDNPARVAGRGIAGAGVSYFTSPYVGIPLSGVAAYGDARAAIESGVTNLEGVIQSAIGGHSGTAGGGFVLYPNRPNTNMMQSVYSK